MYPASLRVPTSIQPSPTLFAHREHFAERKKCRTLCRLCKNFPKLRLTEIPVVLFGSKKNRPSRLDVYKHLQTHLHTSSGAIFLDDEGSDEINTSSIGNAEGDINIIEENENSTASATIERSAPGEKRKRGRPRKVLSTEELELQRREAEDITNLRQRLRGMTRRQKELYKSAQSLTFTPLSSYGIGPKV